MPSESSSVGGRRDGRPQRPRGGVAGWLGAVLLGAAAWFAVPRPRGAPPPLPPLLAVLVDGSASVTRTRPRWNTFVRRQLSELCAPAEPDAEWLVVEYAAEVRVRFGPGTPDALRARLEARNGEPLAFGPAPDRALETELGRALELAAEELLDPARAVGRLVILSDGTYTGGDPAPHLARLAQAGVQVEWLPSMPRERTDLALVGLDVADEVELGAPVAVGVRLALARGLERSAREPERFELRVELRGPGGLRQESVALALPPGLTPDEHGIVHWRTRVELDPPGAGWQHVRVRALRGTGRGPDAVPENDAAGASFLVGDPLVCVILPAPARRAVVEAWAAAQPFEGVQFELASSDRLALALEHADVLWTFDVGPARLPADELTRFVRAGGGWLLTGGWGLLEGWRAEAEPGELSALLPLMPDLPEGAAREVLLLVDGSGSMAGEPFERVRAAALELALGASASDRFHLRFFTGQLGPLEFSAEGKTLAERRRELRPLLAARVPRGPTDVLFSLDQAAAAHQNVEPDGSAQETLLLLLSDGRTVAWDAEMSGDVRRRLIESNIDLRVLAVGDDPDEAFLASLLVEGESIVRAGDLEQLAELLHREVNAERVRQAAGMVAIAAAADEVAGMTGAAEILAAQATQDGGALGPLRRYVLARARPSADVLWRSSDGDPLLGLGRAGAGQVATCVTIPGSEWSPFLHERMELFDPLLRSLGRLGRSSRERPRLFASGDRLRFENAPVGWPGEVEARFFERRSAPLAPSGYREVELGRVRLTLPLGAVDPRTPALRWAARPAFLDARLPGELLRVELSTCGGEPLDSVPWVTPVPMELELAGARVLTPTTGSAPVVGARASEMAAPHPWVPRLLACGMLLLAGAALSLRRRGQGMAGSGRR